MLRRFENSSKLPSRLLLRFQSSSSSSTLINKLSVDPIAESGGSTLVQRQMSDSALKKAGKISASLPKFGRKAKEEEKQKRIEELRRKIKMEQEEEEFLSSQNPEKHFKDAKEEQQADEDAWSSVSQKYGFALKPDFTPNYRSFLVELQKYEMNWRLASPTDAIFVLEILKRSASSSSSMDVIETIVTDANEAHAFSDMLLWTKNVLEALHFGAGFSDLKRIGSIMIPFAVKQQKNNNLPKNKKKKEEEPDEKSRNLDDVSTFRHATNIGKEGYRQQELREDPMLMTDGENTNNAPNVQFLKLECSMHPDTPNALLFPPNRNLNSVAPVPASALSRWAVVTLERDTTTTSDSFFSSNKNYHNHDNESCNDKNKNKLLSVSLSSWTYMQLSSLISVLSRNDVGVVNYEMVSTLHSQKDLEPTWHTMRKLAGMHPAPWPIDPRLLWYPGKR